MVMSVNMVKLKCKVCKTVFFRYGEYFPRWIPCENPKYNRMLDLYKEQVKSGDNTPQLSMRKWCR